MSETVELELTRLRQAITRLDKPIPASRLDPQVAQSLTDELMARFSVSAEAAAAAAKEATQASVTAAKEADAAKAVADAALLEAQKIIARAKALEARLNELSEAAAAPPREPTLPPPSLYYGAGGPYAGDDKGATATSADYAQVAIEWAEHMPDTIPPNILAINAISGNHWSSRWWAGQAASIVATATAVHVFCEAFVVTSGGVLPNLSHTPNGPLILVINGMTFLPVGAQPPFSVSGSTISWTSPIYALLPGTEVAVWYPYAP